MTENMVFCVEVSAGKDSLDNMEFVGVKDLDKLKNVEGVLELTNIEDGSKIGDYRFFID